MAAFARGDRVRFSFSGEVVIAELFTIQGTIKHRRVYGGHYVYDVKLATRVNLPSSLIGGVTLINNVLTNVPGSWLELLR